MDTELSAGRKNYEEHNQIVARSSFAMKVGTSRVLLASTPDGIASVSAWIHSECKQHGIAIDCEWPVDLRKGGSGPGNVSLIQLAGLIEEGVPVVALLHVASVMQSGSHLPDELLDLLSDGSFCKAGVNVKCDGTKIAKDLDASCKGLIELDTLAKDNGLFPSNGSSRWSLALLASDVLGVQMQGKNTKQRNRSARCSDWDAWPLSSEQLSYAAQDAEVSYMLMRELVARCAASFSAHAVESILFNRSVNRFPSQQQNYDKSTKGPVKRHSIESQSTQQPSTSTPCASHAYEKRRFIMHSKYHAQQLHMQGHSLGEIAQMKSIKVSTVCNVRAKASLLRYMLCH